MDMICYSHSKSHNEYIYTSYELRSLSHIYKILRPPLSKNKSFTVSRVGPKKASREVEVSLFS